MKISETGYWEEICSHHTDEGLKKTLVEFLKDMGSIVDFGCGDASYIKHISSNLNIKVEGYDGNPNVDTISGGVAKQLDLSNPFDFKKKFDVVMSLEVAEHIPKEYENIYVNNLITHCGGYLIISWAIPGQGGKGHVNEQPNKYVLNLFKNLGFEYLEEFTECLRSNITNCIWFKNTIFIFKKQNI